jgi:hypothetical protein
MSKAKIPHPEPAPVTTDDNSGLYAASGIAEVLDAPLPEHACVIDLSLEAFREAREQARDHGWSPEQTFLKGFLPRLALKGLTIQTATPPIEA